MAIMIRYIGNIEHIRNMEFKRKIKEFLAFDRKVNFVVAGAQKAGTSALDNYLRQNKEVCMADIKETHFFDDDKLKSKPNYYKYHSYFSPNNNHKVIGESTPIYMYWNNVPKRIYDYNPDMKWVIILRNPIERAYSHWCMEKIRGNEFLDFNIAITYEQILNKQDRIRSYIDRGFYTKQLKKIYRYFPKTNVHLIIYEDFKYDPIGILNGIYDFIGVKRINSVKYNRTNHNEYERYINLDTKDYLEWLYRKEFDFLNNINLRKKI